VSGINDPGPRGPSLDEVLAGEGILEEVTARVELAIRQDELDRERARQGVSVAELARRMGTSRVQVARLLDGANTKVTVESLQRAASALGKRVEVRIVDAPRQRHPEHA
jgi:antitoxin HicB